jgi:hypothetical protein
MGDMRQKGEILLDSVGFVQTRNCQVDLMLAVKLNLGHF